MAGYDALIKALLDVDDKASPKLKDFQKNLGGVTKSLGTLAKVAAGGLGAAFSVAGLASLVKGSIDAADKLNDLAAKTGISTEELSTLSYAVQQSGSDLATLETGLTQLAKSMSLASSVGGKDAEAFDALGVSIKDLRTGELRPTQEVFYSVANAMQKFKDDAGKTTAAMTLLGSASGPGLIPFLNQGEKAIKALQERARELGLELSTRTAQAAGTFKDTVDEVSAVVAGNFTGSLVSLLPVLQTFATYLVEGGESSSVLSFSLKVLADVLRLVGIVIVPIIASVQVLAESLTSVFTAIAYGASGNFKKALDTLAQGGQNIANIGKAAAKAELAFLDLDNTQAKIQQDAAKRNKLKQEQDKKSLQANLDAEAEKKRLAAEQKRLEEERVRIAEAAEAKRKASIKSIKDSFDQQMLSLQAQIDRVNELSLADQAYWAQKHTDLSKYTPEEQKLIKGQWVQIDNQAKLADGVNLLKINTQAYIDVMASSMDQMTAFSASNVIQVDNLTKKLDLLKSGQSQYTADLIDQQNELMDATRQRIVQIESLMLAEKAIQQATVGETSAEAKIELEASKKRFAALQGELKAREYVLETMKLTNQLTMSDLKTKQDISRELEAWNELIGNASKETEKFNYQWELLDKWLAEGVINLGQYINLQDKLMEQGNQAVDMNKEASDKITEFWKSAAKTMEGSMSDFFFDIMQGNMSDLVGNFKKSIDRMVSDLLASQLMEYMFGKAIGKGGDISGLFGSIFGGFKAAGGDVSAGTSYIVGEKGPELFTPTTNGNITPNGAMGGNVTIQISALDGADVMKVLNSRSREIANMVTGTRYANNLR